STAPKHSRAWISCASTTTKWKSPARSIPHLNRLGTWPKKKTAGHYVPPLDARGGPTSSAIEHALPSEATARLLLARNDCPLKCLREPSSSAAITPTATSPS